MSRRRSDDWLVSMVFAPGPQRVETTEHDPTFVARPVGFAPPIADVQECRADAEPVDMPDLWDGDQA